MARANLRDTKIRAALETIGVELAIIHDACQFARLRVEQASRRTGLNSLLDPTLGELDTVTSSVKVVRGSISIALSELVGSDEIAS